MSESQTIGRPLPRIDAEEKVRGEATFAADVGLPHLLVGNCLTCWLVNSYPVPTPMRKFCPSTPHERKH
jgi:CO/xanthine dehydrogenase Mo-binding subunit